MSAGRLEGCVVPAGQVARKPSTAVGLKPKRLGPRSALWWIARLMRLAHAERLRTYPRRRWRTSGAAKHSSVPSALPVTPCRSVKSTQGVDSHFGALGIHTDLATHPQGRQRLAVRPSGRPLPNGPFGRGRERPPSPKARYGIEASVFSHPSASCLGSLPHQRSLAGRPVERRFRGAGPHTCRAFGRRSDGRLRLGSIRRTTPPVESDQAIRSLPHYVGPDVSVSHPIRRLGFDGPIHSQLGDPPIAMRKLLLLGLALLPAQVVAQEKPGRMMLEAGLVPKQA